MVQDPQDRVGMRCGAASSLLRAALEARQNAAGDRRRILVVEDDLAARQLLATSLRRRGYEVLEAQHGPAALAMARRTEPHLIVLDALPPLPDGADTARLLQEDGMTHGIPLVAVLPHPFEGGDEEAQRQGFVACLQRPLAPEQLAEAVAGLLPTLP